MELDITTKDKLLKELQEMSSVPKHYKKLYKPKKQYNFKNNSTSGYASGTSK